MKRYPPPETLPAGLLLALAGGILDAYSYLNRGQVFATAEITLSPAGCPKVSL